MRVPVFFHHDAIIIEYQGGPALPTRSVDHQQLRSSLSILSSMLNAARLVSAFFFSLSSSCIDESCLAALLEIALAIACRPSGRLIHRYGAVPVCAVGRPTSISSDSGSD